MLFRRHEGRGQPATFWVTRPYKVGGACLLRAFGGGAEGDAVYLALGVVGGADEGAGLDVLEAEGEGVIAELVELFGVVVADEGEVPGAGAEVLADGEDVDAVVDEVGEDLV